MRKLAFLLIVLFLGVRPAYADIFEKLVTVEEEDGSPSVTQVRKIQVPNGGLVSDGNKVVSLVYALSAATSFTTSVTITGTGPALYLDPDTGDTWHFYAGNGYSEITDYTAGKSYVRMEAQSASVFLPQGNLIIGDLGTTAGRLSLGGNSLTLASQGNLNFGANGVSYLWPTADGTSGQFIRTDAAGNLSFATGSGGNSFETITPPAGTAPVADSSTDTLTLTEGAGLDITGTAGTDTLDFDFDETEIGSATWGSGGPTYTWTWNVLGTSDTTLTIDGGLATIDSGSSGVFRVTDTLDVRTSVPNLTWTDTDGDDFEAWADAGIWGLANTTNGAQIVRTTQEDGFQTIGKLTTEGGAELNGAVVVGSASSPGSVLFAGTGGVISQDNANLFWDDTLNFLRTPTLIGGTATTSDLTLQTTTGVGATGADMHFLVGNNGATEAMTILNNGDVGIGTASPDSLLDVESTVPVIRLTDTDGDDFEDYADANIRYWTNVTDGAVIARTTQANAFQTVGKLVTEGGADLNGIVDMRAAKVVAKRDKFQATLIDPDGVQTTRDTVKLFRVDADVYPFGITLVKARLELNASASPTYTLEEWTDSGTPAFSSTALTMALASQQVVTYPKGAFADSSIAAGNSIRINLDTTALTEAVIYVEFEANIA